jgi:outer membrane protein assembly factor BamB
MFQADAEHSGSVGAGNSGLTSRIVPQLALAETIMLSALGQGNGELVESIPVVVAGYAYIGSSSQSHGGILYKVDIARGTIAGTFAVPFKGGGQWGSGVGGSPAVTDGHVFFASLDGVVYCLDANNLSQQWATDLRNPDHAHNQFVDNSNPPAACWTSPCVVDLGAAVPQPKRVYVGVGLGDLDPGAFGIIYCLDAATGSIVWMFCTNQVDPQQPNRPNFIPPVMPPKGGNHPNVQLPPPFQWYDTNPTSNGASVWSSVAFDPKLRRVYAGTGNPWPDTPLPTAAYSNGLLALDAITGEFCGFLSQDSGDGYRPSDGDVDMSGSPTVYALPGGQSVAGIGGKSGSYFLADGKSADRIAHRQMLPYDVQGQPLPTIDNSGGDCGIFSTAAFDEARMQLFIGIGGDQIDSTSTPFVRAVHADTLADAWPTKANEQGIPVYDVPDTPLYLPTGTAGQTGLSSPSVVNDVAFITTSGMAAIYAFAANSGKCLWATSPPGRVWPLGVAIWQDAVVAAAGDRLLVYRPAPSTGHLAELELDATAGVWRWVDLSTMATAPLPANGSVGFLASMPRAVYRGADAHVYQVAADAATHPNPANSQTGRFGPSAWTTTDLTSTTNAPPAAGDPHGYLATVPRVVYRAKYGHVVELSINPATGHWIAYDFTTDIGAPPAAGDPHGYLATVPRVVYRTSLPA